MASNLIILPDKWLERCREFGARVVANYAAGRSDASKAVSCFNAENNVALQQRAKMCECAFAQYVGASIEFDICWHGQVDSGYDLLWGGKKWDVKATQFHGQYLIWPVAKTHIFDSKHFDCLVLVKEREPQFLIAGWTTKAFFRRHRSVAEEGHKLFPGTRYMHESMLETPENAFLRESSAVIDAGAIHDMRNQGA